MAIRRVHHAAFPTSAEADLVEQLAIDGDLSISLVAEDADLVIGHIAFSAMRVTADGAEILALGLAPVAVIPGRQGDGIGTVLIEAGIGAAKAAGAALIFVLGEPAYYRRFGFDAAEAALFASPYAGPHFMALRLAGPMNRAGEAGYAPAFDAL